MMPGSTQSSARLSAKCFFGALIATCICLELRPRTIPVVPFICFFAFSGLIPFLVKSFDDELIKTTPHNIRGSGKNNAVWQHAFSTSLTSGSCAPAKSVMRIPFRRLSIVGAVPPLLGMYLCVGLSLIFSFDQATYTHCTKRGVINILPSISACIATFPYIWRISIAIMITQRVADGIAYDGYFRMHISFRNSSLTEKPKEVFCLSMDEQLTLLWYSHMLEQAGLVLLTYISSNENHSFHVLGFALFSISSIVHMRVKTTLFARVHCQGEYSIENVDPGPEVIKSYHLKRKMRLINSCSLTMAFFFYVWHNIICMSFIYSLFAMCEYTFVVSNILFHCSAIFDFGDLALYMAQDTPESLKGPFWFAVFCNTRRRTGLQSSTVESAWKRRKLICISARLASSRFLQNRPLTFALLTGRGGVRTSPFVHDMRMASKSCSRSVLKCLQQIRTSHLPDQVIFDITYVLARPILNLHFYWMITE